MTDDSTKHGDKATYANRPSYFETLPPELQEDILRKMSNRPETYNWFTSFLHVEALTALRFSEPLATAAKGCLTHLRLGNSTTSMLHGDPVITRHLMEKQGSRLRSLSIDNTGSRNLDYRAICTCTNLLELTLEENIKARNSSRFLSVFKACGAVLQRLSLRVLDKVAISLLIEYAIVECNSLEMLDVWHPHDLSMIARLAVGNQEKLRMLRIGDVQGDWNENDLHIIARQCTVLSALDAPRHIALPLCIKLGDRLRTYRMRSANWNEHHISVASKCCPNAKIYSSAVFTAEMLVTCSRQLRELVLDSRFFMKADLEEEYGGLAECFSVMHDLEKVKLVLESENGKSLVNAFFRRPKYCLTELEIDNAMHSSIITTVAASTIGVQKFRCITRLPLDDDDFAAFLAANMNLSAISIVVTELSEEMKPVFEERSSRLIRQLRRHSQIRKFSIEGSHIQLSRSKAIENACVPLRWRGINVNVGKVRYLPYDMSRTMLS